mgnify:CR=1 FL=1
MTDHNTQETRNRAILVGLNADSLPREDNASETTLEELAELVHVNKYHLVHTFSTDYGLSPIQYLISRRIEEGKNLLRTTDYSIAQIASFSGFSSQSYFAQTFQKSMGMSPTQYRRQARSS